MAILEIRDLHYGYGSGKDRHEVLRGLEASFEQGKLYAVTGKSGAGKSTLLSLLSALTLPQQGEILFEGTATSALDPLEYRRRCVAVIYQDFALFPLLNVTENIMYPMELCGVAKDKALSDARDLAARVGLGEELWSRYPSAISGPGHGHGPAADPGGRAHRQSGQREQRPDRPAAAGRGPPQQLLRHRGDPRPGRGRAGRRGAADAGRRAGQKGVSKT